MAADEPEIDGRSAEELREYAEEIAPYYTDDWDAESPDAGTALLRLFSELAGDVVERLDRVPEKHRVAFFDRLGFESRPPQPARLPLTVAVADGASENVVVPGGTRAVGPAERTFEVAADDGFEATPANLRRCYSVDPASDGIFEHHDAVAGDAEATLFDGENEQEHVLHVGHAGGLAVKGSADEPATVRVAIDTRAAAPRLRDHLDWEFYGKRTEDADPEWLPVGEPPGEGAGDGAGPIDLPGDVDPGDVGSGPGIDPGVGSGPGDIPEPGPGVEPGEPPEPRYSDGPAVLDLDIHGTVVERTVEGVESRWLRCRLPANPDEEAAWLFDVSFGGTDEGADRSPVRVGPVPASGGSRPETLLYNDVELSPTGGDPAGNGGGATDGGESGNGEDADDGENAGEDEDTGEDGDADDGENDSEDASESENGGEGDGSADALHPLGTVPRQQDAFYVADEEAFTKAGAAVELAFEPPAGDAAFPGIEEGVPHVSAPDGDPTRVTGPDVDPDVTWEYWNGSAWARLDAEDGTRDLTKRAVLATADDGEEPGLEPVTVAFEVPDDLASTEVSGHAGHWVRARLVGGDYGGVTATETDGTWTTTRNDRPPTYGGLHVTFQEDPDDLLKPAGSLLARNNLASADEYADAGAFRPFVPTPDDDQACYLGFDAPLSGGPVNLLFSVAESAYPEGFHPRVRWEQPNPDDGSWVELGATDGTRGLTERGIVGLAFPETTGESGRFGERFHWVRARVTGTPFGAADGENDGDGGESGDGADDADGNGADGCGSGESGDAGPEPCRERVRTEPPAGEPANTEPVLDGVHPNAVWARNVRNVDDELLGSSDGSADQSFAVASPPVTDAEVWVDELATLSAGQRETLRERWPDRVEAETGPDGEPSAFWVRWEAVPGLLNSGEDDRHYRLERAAGRVVFGDGSRGRIPPRGSDNVRASYRTGGGADGNVEAGAVGDLKSPLPFVDAVTNPEPADGGADAESTDEVLDRAPKELRDRGRAVTAADFERVALDASRQLARASCIPAMDREGGHAPGWVTLLVVPSSPVEKPSPSVTLRETVRDAVADRAPATLVADPEQLVVRGPSYVAVSLEIELVADGSATLSTVEDAVGSAVAEFLHPLSGGEDGDGWSFGTLPCQSACYALVEGVDGVDHVVDLTMTFRADGPPVTVREGEPVPDVTSDALVHSGDHEITARTAGSTGRPTDGGA